MFDMDWWPTGCYHGRWVKEAIQIRKTEADNLNRDEGQYFLTHIFDDLLTLKNILEDLMTPSSDYVKQ